MQMTKDQLFDQAKDQAYDSLVEHIDRDMTEHKVRLTLERVAEVYLGDGTLAEKYAAIADVLDDVVMELAETLYEDMLP